MDTYYLLLASTLIVAALLGAVFQRTQFCTMGAFVAFFSYRDLRQLLIWGIATLLAAFGLSLLQLMSLIDLTSLQPNYLTNRFNVLSFAVGGFLFGCGMTLSGGCTSRNIVRLAGGNLRAMLVLLSAGAGAFMMTKTTFYEFIFYRPLSVASISLSEYGITTQSLLALPNLLFSTTVSFAIVLVAIVIKLTVVAQFTFKRYGYAPVQIGLLIGLGSLVLWWLTGSQFGAHAFEATLFYDFPPASTGVQSLTTVNPLAEWGTWLLFEINLQQVTVGMVIVFGLLVGALLSALYERRFRWVGFHSLGDSVVAIIGGWLMGIGGTLALGCSLGLGISGLATLSIGAFIGVLFMGLGCFFTFKLQSRFV